MLPQVRLWSQYNKKTPSDLRHSGAAGGLEPSRTTFILRWSYRVPETFEDLFTQRWGFWVRRKQDFTGKNRVTRQVTLGSTFPVEVSAPQLFTRPFGSY